MISRKRALGDPQYIKDGVDYIAELTELRRAYCKIMPTAELIKAVPPN